VCLQKQKRQGMHMFSVDLIDIDFLLYELINFMDQSPS
jgi:hypothetical protein